MLPEDSYTLPNDELKMMDDAQKKANKDQMSLLPCDPCMCVFKSDTEPADPEIEDFGLEIEDELYQL